MKNYIEEVLKKISKIHQKLPPGGILVFLTGQEEIRDVCTKLRAQFPPRTMERSDERILEPRVKCLVKQMDMEAEDVEIEQDNEYVEEEEFSENDSNASVSDESEFEDLVDESLSLEAEPLHVLPLFSLLPVADQLKVFQPVPEGSRLCVVATNIAETSLTIPGIKYVVDCGRVKERVYEKATGVESFQIGWISKASAAQRAGRAGRTGPGHCYRLYSSAVFERDFAQFSEPEILKYPIEGKFRGILT
jgi:ATP-dependent RNA helicase DHX37/DHR1